jgi:hypothetical protein
MSRSDIVPFGVQAVDGGGAQSSSPREAEPPSVSFPLLRELSGEQLAGLAVFCSVHSGCPDVEVAPTWDGSLTVPIEVVCYCPTCGEARSYDRESGSWEGGDTPA